MNKVESDMDKCNASKALQQEINSKTTRSRRIKQLIDLGADINYQAEDDGYTALMLAVDADNQRITEYLLTLGANPLLCNHSYEIASELALRHSPIYLTLKDYELLFATLNNDLANVKSILDAGAIINFQAPDGYTALLIAVDQSLVDMTKYLLTKDPDINLTRADGKGVFELVTDEEVYLLLQARMPINNNSEDALLSPLELIRSSGKKSTTLFFGFKNNKNTKEYEKIKVINEAQRHGSLPFYTSQLNIRSHNRTDIKPTATNDQIEELENSVGHALPESYKAILREHNGGTPALHHFDADEEAYSLNYFYSLGDKKDSSLNIWWAADRFSALAGPETLPFAEDATNNVYFFKWIDEIAQVWILRCDELEEPEADFVAHSFDELLCALHDAN